MEIKPFQCYLHQVVSTFNEKNSKMLSYTLKVPQLVPGAIPLLFSNCPIYLSTPTISSRCSLLQQLVKKKTSCENK